MQEFFTRIVRQLNDFWEKTERRDRIRFFTIGALAIAAIIVAFVFLTRTEYTVLYRDMDPDQAGEVLSVLTEMGVSAKPQGEGVIMVPAGQADTLRMQLASQGFPKSGFNYDVFAQGTGFGTTEFEKRTYQQYQLQERIANTIKMYDGIKDAVVTLTQPDTSRYVFRPEIVPSTAAVMLYMDSGAALTSEQIGAIELLVSTSVENLKPENVSITDNFFRRLNHKEGLDFSTLQTNHDYEAAYRNELILSLQSLLTPIFGQDKVRIGVNVVLNFDKRSSQRVTFTPVVDDRGIERSMSETVEKLTGGSGVAGIPGTDTNGAAPEYPELTDTGTGSYSNTIREVNYEVNQLNEEIESAQGQVEELTVSVAIDSKDLEPDSASADQIAAIVAGSMGLVDNQANIVVEFLPFNGSVDTSDIEDQINREREQERLFEFIKTIALYAIIAACIIVLIITTAKIFKNAKGEQANLALAQFDNMDAEVDEFGNLIDLATRAPDISETAKSQERVLIEDFIDKKPDSAADLLRNWLTEEKGGR